MRLGNDRVGHASLGGSLQDDTEDNPKPLPIEEVDKELSDSIAIRPDVSERQRIESYLKRPFQTPITDSGEYRDTDYGRLISLFAGFAEEISTVEKEVLASRYVDHAYGQSLDYIGEFVQIPRRSGESDPHYRLRLKAQFRRLLSSGTINEVRESTALLLDTSVSNIEFDEPFDSTPATFILRIESTILDEAPITTNELIDFVEGFSAGGVEVIIEVTGAFRHQSLEEHRSGRSGEYGYDEAPYSGRIN